MVTAAIPAKTNDDPADEWGGAFDYAAIGRICDYIMLMTYDEHWFGGSRGPIASLPWVVSVLDFAIKFLPREKILLGIPAYGYDWSATGTRVIPWNKVNELINQYGWSQVAWDDLACVPYLRYTDKGVAHEVWFENAYSLRIKLNLVRNYGLAGVAIWRLGFEDATFWETRRAAF
ncbi:glycosyl hydrolase family 18 protein [Thermodesulfitimonas sp.]